MTTTNQTPEATSHRMTHEQLLARREAFKAARAADGGKFNGPTSRALAGRQIAGR